MNIEDIKVGETYNVRMKFANIDEDGNYCFNMETKPYIYRLFNKTDVETCVFPMPDPANGTKNTEPAPKYDPCHLFKAGDVVEYRPKDGRANPNLLVGRRYKVSVDEPCDSGIVQVEFDGLRHIDTFVAYNNLELVTPVEELERYYIEHDSTGFAIVDRLNVGYVAHFKAVQHPHAKEAAEAERDRLNAEHRKEQE